ncbi:MAG TPA: DUF2029 domain-containing protein [Chloroflexi bacterium]|nr:DUF2029 domain-containing protein [Chloroflexota bacterium]
MRERLIATLLLITAFAINVVFTYSVFTSRYPGANDFYSRWAGARAFWRDGLSPYSDEATLQIQMGIYGRPARPDEDPGLFAYPFYTVFFLWPLVWLPYPWVQAIWMALLEFMLLGGVWIAFSIYGWQPPPGLRIATLLWSLFFYYGARAIILGQFAVVVFFFTTLTFWALKEGRDYLAGAALSLTSFKPQMVFLLIPLLVWWGIIKRRWRFLAALAGAFALLLGASWALEPSWLQGFLHQVSLYPSYTAIGSPVWIITNYYFPILGRVTELLLSLALLAYLVFAWHKTLQTDSEEAFHWSTGMCLIITNLIALRTATTNYVILLLPTLFGFKFLAERFHTLGLWLISGVEAISFAGLWVLFLATVVGEFEHPIMYLPFPLILLAFFLFLRQLIT